MKVQDITCPSCGANLSISDEEKSQKVTCAFCGKDFWVSDEVTRSESKVSLTVDNAEQAGYLFEKGRIAAYQELNQIHNSQVQETPKSPKVKNLWWLKLLGWVLFFPLMLIYRVLKSKRMSWGEKLLLCGLIVFITIILTSGGGS